MSELGVEAGTGRYAVQGAIGRGGMGAVYRVADRKTGSEVALKRLRLSDDVQRNRRLVALFEQEFRTLAQLAHPNVVTVHDFGTDEHGPYYTMELLQGQHLHALAPLPWAETCALMRDVCSAVALLHARRLLHRDLSPKNVQRTPEGRAKLLDFGAMAPMGPCVTIVGTPPFMPPEALLQQTLDARADLYAIGGTLYYALTGKHAYPAKDAAQLGALWRTPPVPPSVHVPGIPPELDRLVLALLSLERMARPASAAEVLDRLTAIASLSRDEQVAVPRAYLATPELVGRSEELTRVRRRLTDLHAGYGAVIAIEGAPGMGRSRMLDTCVLEAKLARVFVARASAADAVGARYGTAGALARQLEVFCRDERVAAEESPAFSLLTAGNISAVIDSARRIELQAAFQARLKAIAQVQPVLIAIDDIERCDEPSRATLAAAAAACARDRVLIIVTTTSAEQAATRSRLKLLLEDAVLIPLAPLSLEHSEALLASVFGDAPYLRVLARRIHERAEGSPRGCMELSQYLVDHKLVHYEIGSWVVPSSLAEAELPGTLSAARLEKLAGLSADARELAETLALAQGTSLELEAFAELTAHGDYARVQAALDELLLAQILRIEHAGHASYVFEAQQWRDELQEALAPQVMRRACSRIAAALARRGRDRLDVARFRLRASEPDGAIDALLEELKAGSRWDRAPNDYGKLLRQGLEACRELARPRADRIALLRELVRLGQDLASPDLRVHTLDLIAELSRDSGLSDWHTPGGPSEPFARLQHVCSIVQQRQETAAPEERGLAQLDAIIALVQLASETFAVAARTTDATLIEIVPSLTPFYPLSPAVKDVETRTLPACRAVVAGRYEEARALYQQQLATMLDPASVGVPEHLRAWGIRALHYGLGSIEASMGREQALAHSAAIKDVPGWLVPAYSIRQVYYLTLGDLRQAERYRKRIEIALLQSAAKPPLAAAAVFQHVFVYVITENPNGLRKAIPELEALAVAHPGMRPFVPFARAQHARICGNYEEALSFADSALAMVRPGEHSLWVWLVSARLFTLFAMGRYDEACAEGYRELETSVHLRLGITTLAIELPLALNEAKRGDFEGACRRLDAVIATGDAFGLQGVSVGTRHEARARVAVWMNDKASFEHHAQRCAQHFERSGGDPSLAAKYERLMQEARQYDLGPSSQISAALADQTTMARSGHTEEALTPLATELHACASRPERLRRALDLLVSEAAALHGELFVLGAGGLTLAASTREGLGGSELLPTLSRIADVGAGEINTALAAAFQLEGPAQPDGSPTQVWPLVLARSGASDIAVAGVATLHFAASAAVKLPVQRARALAAVLIAAGDVEPHVVSGGSVTTMDS